MKVQTHISTEDGELFDLSICTNEIIFKIIELTKPEIAELTEDIKAQVFLLSQEYK